MGWIRDLLSRTDNSIEEVQTQPKDRFPPHTYGAGFPITIHRQELNDLNHLLKKESKAPNSWDNTPLLSREDFEEMVGDSLGNDDDGLPTPEERRGEIHKILELWQEQITGSEGAVWTTIGTDYQFKFYITHCEARAGSEADDFVEPDELDTAREILNRIQTAQNTDAKLAIVHKRDLPLDEPEEKSPEPS